ncbi:M28 family peptidase [Nannocystaceae bacterium ST9]
MTRRPGLLLLVLGLIACRGPEREPGPSATPATIAEAPAPAPPPISEDPVVLALLELSQRSEVDDHLRVLAVDIGPRLSGSKGLDKAEQWAIGEFERWGLAAGRERWGEFAVGFERGPAKGAMIRPERKDLEFGTWAWTPGTPGGAPKRGQALRYPATRAELDDLEPRLRDAWIVLPFDVHPRPGKDDLDARIARVFEREGIAGFVLAAGKPDDRTIEFHGEHEIRWNQLPDRVEVRLRGDQHAELIGLLDAGEFVQLEFAIAQEFVQGPIALNNVIADLPGEDPSQSVIVGGHLDSWDGASGAIDNATGVAVTMEAARLLALAIRETGEQPDRSIRFMLWSGEEQGLLGSQAWVTAHPEQLPGIAAVLVHDGGTNYVSGLPVTPEMYAAMQQVFAPVRALLDRTRVQGEVPSFRLDLVESLPYEPSDSTPFLSAGVPAFYWSQSGKSDYELYHHTQLDHADAVIDDYQRHSALVVAIAAWNLAELDAPLDRHNMQGLEPRRLGVYLEGNVVRELAEGGLAKRVGIVADDRIVALDDAVITDDRELVAALQRGGSHKRATIERAGGESPESIQIELDWTDEPDEAERERRRRERQTNFPIELRPWDDE